MSRNVRIRDFVHYAAIAALNILMRLPHRLIGSLLNNKFAMQVRRVVGNRAQRERDNQTAVSTVTGVTGWFLASHPALSQQSTDRGAVFCI